ncbi:hypothetical protein [Paracoccus marinaquae]|uniref:Uncharacterized protein n=1 Tax=Paracoccus marinaquae TaxID=2841926 RepID=A0ABS6AKR9_9RHOB|nr:hypothetical protein [Paracoccus marinaquae]MBU3031158.1 hypothetical protein [Paracoccus marinaquae]
MKNVADRLRPKGLKVLAHVEFTPDMAVNLMSMCDSLREGERLVLEICDWGVWGKTTEGVRLFLGSTTVLNEDRLSNDNPINH